MAFWRGLLLVWLATPWPAACLFAARFGAWPLAVLTLAGEPVAHVALRVILFYASMACVCVGYRLAVWDRAARPQRSGWRVRGVRRVRGARRVRVGGGR